ncbi:right-handed parallel beta-helix repeat-containing protein [Paenibacillus caui]|uniref:right-handed parallel beta-helix repeat-containing protein n=1 Tax=Paenibacillus caui TaxID=2873927 RepID=UPI001CA80A44|nr:right-handed parallel beta-helix repeat-containing protein [Paenibacillus caui]
MSLKMSEATVLVLFILVFVIQLAEMDQSEPDVMVSSASASINVKHLGAKGDGKTNDTWAVQKALQLASSGGWTVFFPKGTYLIDPSKEFIVPGNTTLAGEGRRSVIKASSAAFGWELMRAAGSDITINHLSLDGNNHVNRVLVVGGGCERVTLSNLVVANASQSRDPGSDGYGEVVCGIVVYGDTKQIAISAVEVKNIVAVNVSNGSMIARGIYITTTWGSQESVAKQVSITGSYVHHVGPADDGDGIYFEDPGMDSGNGQHADSFIANNVMDHVAKRAVKIYAEGITVRDNHIINSYLNNNVYQGVNKGMLAPDMFSAISVYGSSNTVDRNTIDGIGSYYAAIEISAGQTIGHIRIARNKITMGSKSNIKGTTAIRLGNINDFTISGNTIQNGERGIWTWQNASQGLISGNSIVVINGGGIDISTYLNGCVQRDIRIENNTITAGTFDIQLAPTNINVIVV